MPPTIPTSFVPKQPARTETLRGGHFNFQGLFLLIAFFILGLALVASAVVFVYGRYLDGQAAAKVDQLAKAQQNISESTVEQFIWLNNRLTLGEKLLDTHVTLSSFFSLFESLTLQRVQFTSLNLTVKDDRTASLQANGTAASFNALAAESHAFSANPDVKNAIFGNFTNQKGGAVSFSLSAILTPAAVAAFAPSVPTSAPTQVLPIATTTATTTTQKASLPVATTTTPAKSASTTSP
jgi:hypothetical protein